MSDDKFYLKACTHSRANGWWGRGECRADVIVVSSSDARCVNGHRLTREQVAELERRDR